MILVLAVAFAAAPTFQSAMNDPNKDRSLFLEKAMHASHNAIPAAEASGDQPGFHFHAPAQWMNDPNGPIYYDGWYHLFYQFNPFGDQWGNMHWGHARSRDLVNWEYLPVALWPSKDSGEDAVFSGSCHLVNGVPTAFYTSIGDHRGPEQWMAKPLDKVLIEWKKEENNPILKTGKDQESDLQEWRDPFLFEHLGSTYMVTGGGKDGHGIVALYLAKDRELNHWEYKGILFQHPDKDVANIECPNLARLDGKWVLLVSVHGRVESFVGSFTPDLKFEAKFRDVLCPGSYASQLMFSKGHDLIHFAWVPTDRHRGWNGLITLPSKLTISSDGHLLRNPVSGLKELRGDEVDMSNHDLVGEEDLSDRISGELLEVIATVESSTPATFGIKLRCSKDGSRSVVAKYDLVPNVRTEIHLFLDRGVVEEFVGGGRSSSVKKFDSGTEDQGIRMFREGGTVILRTLKIFKLHPAKFSTSELRAATF